MKKAKSSPNPFEKQFASFSEIHDVQREASAIRDLVENAADRKIDALATERDFRRCVLLTAILGYFDKDFIVRLASSLEYAENWARHEFGDVGFRKLQVGKVYIRYGNQPMWVDPLTACGEASQHCTPGDQPLRRS